MLGCGACQQGGRFRVIGEMLRGPQLALNVVKTELWPRPPSWPWVTDMAPAQRPQPSASSPCTRLRFCTAVWKPSLLVTGPFSFFVFVFLFFFLLLSFQMCFFDGNVSHWLIITYIYDALTSVEVHELFYLTLLKACELATLFVMALQDVEAQSGYRVSK